jgi:hypothetical protein
VSCRVPIATRGRFVAPLESLSVLFGLID